MLSDSSQGYQLLNAYTNWVLLEGIIFIHLKNMDRESNSLNKELSHCGQNVKNIFSPKRKCVKHFFFQIVSYHSLCCIGFVQFSFKFLYGFNIMYHKLFMLHCICLMPLSITQQFAISTGMCVFNINYG